MPVRPGTVAVLAVLLGTTAYDSFSAMPQWRNFVDANAGAVPLGAVAIRTAGLLVFAAAVGITFHLAARGHRRRGPCDAARTASWPTRSAAAGIRWDWPTPR